MGYTTTAYDYASTAEASDLLLGGALGAILSTYIWVMLAFSVLMIVANWRIFTKAGQEGWKAIIPIYNVVIQYKIVGLSPWLLLLVLIPFVGPMIVSVLQIISIVKLGQAFEKSTGFILGLVFLSPIFLLILAFDKSEYVGAEKTTPTNPTDENV